MRFKITGDQRKVIEAQKYIEFEDLFSLAQIEEVSQHVDELLSKRSRGLIDALSSEELFRVGRDLWRDDPFIRDFVCHRGLAQIAADLFGQKKIQLGFDQALRTTARPGFSNASVSTLQQKSCISPLVCAVVIRLSGDAKYSSLLPQKKENAIFLAPHLTIPWELFFQEPHQSFLLIAYGAPASRYILEKNDIHVHAMKKLGYGFGDTLNPAHHPFLYK